MTENTEEQFTFHGYEITTDNSFQHARYGITPDLAVQLEKAALGCQNKSEKRVVEKMTNLVRQYPHIPMFKNYLMVAYRLHGNRLKADELNERIIQEHPDYLFGKLNQANGFIDRGEPGKVPGILGASLELRELYPERKLFHYAEYTNYMNVVIRYFAAVKDLETAERKLSLLEELAPDDPVTEQADSFLWMLRLERAAERIQEEQKQRITPIAGKYARESDRTAPPEFNHIEIENLYRYGMSIPHYVLEEILALPRETLTEDLLSVLSDAADRYQLISKGYGDENATYFPLHAFFILMELKAGEALPAMLDFLAYDNDFEEFWLGDHRTNSLWQCIFQPGRNNLGVLQDFLIKPGIDTYSKTTVSEALCQMVLHYPEMRPDILSLYSTVFETFAESTIDDNLIDTDFLGLAIGNTIDCGLAELLPVIKKLFDRQYVALSIGGDFRRVESEFSSPLNQSKKRTVQSIFELYDEVADTWIESGGESSTESDYISRYTPQPKVQAVSEKIGRNDPCPCGSGKKYKKCCME
ncbi:MAG: DUF1186 domain-containing protein [Bacteroidota bacterium]